MRKLRFFQHVSLDGVIQVSRDPGDASDFLYSDWTKPYRTPAGFAYVLEAQGERFDLLLGRRTYDIWSGFWPQAPQSPMSDRLNGATKYVATHRPESLSWGPAQGVGPDLVESVRQIKATSGPDVLLWGSSTLTSTLLEHGLVDEVMLFVYPVMLGQGKRLFAEGTPARTLSLMESKSLPSGIVICQYQVAGAIPAVN
ncbi:MAG: dihydrofolate reductase family protein [Gemmataceae bacterium]